MQIAFAKKLIRPMYRFRNSLTNEIKDCLTLTFLFLGVQLKEVKINRVIFLNT